MKDVSRKARLARTGQCVNCSGPAREPGHTVCKRCLELMRRGQAERRRQWRLKGMCIYCGRPREEGLACCERCHARRRASRIRKAAE